MLANTTIYKLRRSAEGVAVTTLSWRLWLLKWLLLAWKRHVTAECVNADFIAVW